MKTWKPVMTTLAVTLALSGAAFAQETSSTAARARTAATATESAITTSGRTDSVDTASRPYQTGTSTADRVQVREQFSQLLSRHPDELTRVFVLDPTLLANQAFLAKYPEVAQFLNEHPEVRANPHYYLAPHDFERQPPHIRTAAESLSEVFGVVFVVGIIATALAWFVRTFVEQKRWTQLSRRQSEVHSKILDRLGSSEELLAYVKSPAGTKYLESAPIALHAAPPRERGPMGRVLLSIQIGIIVASAGAGLLLVSARSTGDAEQGFFAMGAIAACIGAGFIASAFISMLVSRRLGMWQDEGGSAMADDAGLVR